MMILTNIEWTSFDAEGNWVLLHLHLVALAQYEMCLINGGWLGSAMSNTHRRERVEEKKNFNKNLLVPCIAPDVGPVFYDIFIAAIFHRSSLIWFRILKAAN